MTASRSLFPLLALFAGCASSITTLDGRDLSLNSTEFREYFEAVFRDQNDVATQLAFAQSDSDDSADWLELEDDLFAACAGLNELVLARANARVISPGRQARLAATAPNCEAMAALVRDRLENRR